MNIIFLYIVAIAGVELVGTFVSPFASIWLHGGLILLLLGHYLAREKAPYRRVLPVLMLAPLLRILSLVMPVRPIPQIYWYALVGAPLLLAGILVVRLLDLPKAGLGLQLSSPFAQGLIALSGVPLGIAAFWILEPRPIVPVSNWGMVLIASAILAVFSGFAEEFIFRGLLQQVAGEAFGGRVAVLCSTIVFAAMYVGSLSLIYLAFIGLVGLFFGYCAHKTRSIWGVTLAHSVMNILLIVVWPAVARGLG